MNSIMHRDLKPQNVLIGVAKNQVKITDFGLARCFLPNADRAYTERVVTLYYRAPELLLGAPTYTSAVDLWSVGCIMAEMVNFEPLFKADNEIGLLFHIFEKLGTPNKDVWRELPGLAHFSDQFPSFPGKPMQEVRGIWPCPGQGVGAR
ncbi:hypothetical protein Vretimale_4482 [Volvox reticuliferus]|nr:hypothetical protein Vretimale_4482 [Volvox reticuliferus]